MLVFQIKRANDFINIFPSTFHMKIFYDPLELIRLEAKQSEAINEAQAGARLILEWSG